MLKIIKKTILRNWSSLQLSYIQADTLLVDIITLLSRVAKTGMRWMIPMSVKCQKKGQWINKLIFCFIEDAKIWLQTTKLWRICILIASCRLWNKNKESLNRMVMKEQRKAYQQRNKLLYRKNKERIQFKTIKERNRWKKIKKRGKKRSRRI